MSAVSQPLPDESICMDRLPGTAQANPVPTLPSQELRDVLSSGRSALVAFSASWSPYDLLLQPRLARLRELLGERLLVGRVDVKQCPELVQQLRIRWIPAVGFIHQGRVVRRWYGADVDVEQLHACVSRTGG